MLNVINGFYKPTSGQINFAGEDRKEMIPEFAAKSGIARTFQNIALFKGMSTLDNLMTGRLLKQKQNFLMQALYFGPVQKEEAFHRDKVERVIDFLDLQAIRRTPVGSLPYGLQKRGLYLMDFKKELSLAELLRWNQKYCYLMNPWQE